MTTPSSIPSPAVLDRSPFGALFAAYVEPLPAVLRDHYLVSADTSYRVVLEGTMDRIWHRPAWLWPFFWLLIWMDLLFPETGTQIPATMTVTGGRAANGHDYQTWDRTFKFASHRHFNAIMVYDSEQNCVVERLGPGHRLQMAWAIHFLAPASIEIVTTNCTLRLGRWRVQLPHVLYPSVRAVETALLDQPDTIHIDLAMTHVWLGPIFGYDGTFILRHESIGAL
jgi:uncharacterized protein DUF4166